MFIFIVYARTHPANMVTAAVAVAALMAPPLSGVRISPQTGAGRAGVEGAPFCMPGGGTQLPSSRWLQNGKPGTLG